VFLIVLPQSLIKFPPSSVNVHTICLISGTMLNCVLAFYTSEYLLLFFFSLLIDHVLLPLRHPSDWLWGNPFHKNWYQSIQIVIIIIGIRVESMWRYLRSSSIFKSLMVSSISAGGRLGWTPSWPKAGWRKSYSGGRKSLKIWRKKLDMSWVRKPWWLFSFVWWTKC